MSEHNNTPHFAILIGAGQRGHDVYGAWARKHPHQLDFVAVAEPDPDRRARFAAAHRIPPDRQFDDWRPLLDRPQLAPVAIIATQDTQHTAPTLAALHAGYHVLLEKPMATTAADSIALAQAAETTGRQLHIAHVLRYTRHFQTLRQIIQSGELGQLIHVDHRENVSWWHMAHSYVRGHWRREDQSSPMLLAKSCHDLDILIWLLNSRAETLSSVGNLRHYRPENAPAGATKRCLDGCPAADTCPFYAPFIYIELQPLYRALADGLPPPYHLAAQAQVRAPGLMHAIGTVIPPLRTLSDHRGWPRSVVHPNPTDANLRAALETGPYGRCVYHCDNDVVDHQVVSMAFENGLSVTFTMHGHSHREGRSTTIHGSQAELRAWFGTGGSWIDIREHRSNHRRRIDTSRFPPDGHGGGDDGFIRAALAALQPSNPAAASSTARDALESHLMAFAAEHARHTQTVVRMADFRPT